MAAPFIKKEEEIDSINYNNDYCSSNIINNKREKGSRGRGRGTSIAERRAAKCGFNASNINAAAPSPPLFTVPPGLSPSALLESPIMLPNAQAQLSPTTGTFRFPSPNHESLKLKLKVGSNGEDRVDANNNFIIENKPSEEILQKVEAECFDYISNINHNHNNTTSRNQMMRSMCNNPNIPRSSSQKTNNATVNANVVNNNNSNNNSSKNSEDGFFWRKYGQKHVKGSEYPRSYYKCTNTNCPVTKKVERSHDGHITEIVYKGYHNHPNPVNNNVVNPIITEGGEGEGEGEGGILTTSSSNNFQMMNDPINNTFHDHLDFAPHELVDRRNDPSPESVSFNEDDHNINAADHGINGELCEAKKRKRESGSYCFPGESSSARSTREPKVVVQIESEIDILDDGYRWRKYGQKVVKGNPNPRSYYKCTTPGCPVRKHVERAANDIKSVITTYEGKHNHQVPSTKTGTTTTSISSDIVAGNLQPPSVAANTSSTTKPPPPPPPLGPGGKQIQDNLPSMYLDRKPIFNYNEFIRSGSSDHLNFGPNSSLYPLPFPPFHSLPYTSVFMNSKTYPLASSRLYPIMPMPSSHIHHHHHQHVNAAVGSSATSAMHHYTTTATTTTYAAHHQLQPAETRALKPKEERMRDEDELYDTCLSIPNQVNGTI